MSDTSGHGRQLGDRIFQGFLVATATAVPLLLLFLVYELWVGASPAIDKFGFGFLTGDIWDPVAEEFGAWPLIIGTVLSAVLALCIAVPLSLGVAIFLVEFAPPRVRGPVGFVIELLAAIPSVVYGLWGIFFLIPAMRATLFPFLRETLGFLPFFSGPIYGPSMLTAALILAIMVMPYVMSVSREVLLAVPTAQREAALALGATRWEAVTGAVLPYAKSGIIGAVILGLGRALGETMAVTMTIGNVTQIPTSILNPGYSMASVIANEWGEAQGGMYQSALLQIGLLLFFMSLALNLLARLLVWSVARKNPEQRA